MPQVDAPLAQVRGEGVADRDACAAGPARRWRRRRRARRPAASWPACGPSRRAPSPASTQNVWRCRRPSRRPRRRSPRSPVAVCTSQAPSRSASSTSRARHSTSPHRCRSSSTSHSCGATTTTRAASASSACTRRAATGPPPTTSTRRPVSWSPSIVVIAPTSTTPSRTRTGQVRRSGARPGAGSLPADVEAAARRQVEHLLVHRGGDRRYLDAVDRAGEPTMPREITCASLNGSCCWTASTRSSSSRNRATCSPSSERGGAALGREVVEPADRRPHGSVSSSGHERTSRVVPATSTGSPRRAAAARRPSPDATGRAPARTPATGRGCRGR